MKAFLAFLLVPIAIAGYFFPALAWGVYQRYPVPSFLVAAAGVYLLARLAWSAFSIGRALLSVAAIGLLGFFAYITLFATVYDGTETKLKTGDAFAAPDKGEILLRTAAAAPFDLNQEIAKAPATVIVFYRGFWWMYCRVELVELQKRSPVFQTMGVRVLAISVDGPEDAKRMQEKTGAAAFTFLSDPEGKTLDLLGIRHKAGHDGQDIAQSTTIIVDREAKIRWMAVAETLRVRPDPDLVVREAAKVLGGEGSPALAPASGAPAGGTPAGGPG